jgi:hypothetical protein
MFEINQSLLLKEASINASTQCSKDEKIDAWSYEN